MSSTLSGCLAACANAGATVANMTLRLSMVRMALVNMKVSVYPPKAFSGTDPWAAGVLPLVPAPPAVIHWSTGSSRMSEKNQGTLAVLLQERARIDAELRQHRVEVTVLFTDVVGSTSYYERYGNTAGIVLVQRLDDITNRVLEKFDGRWIKSTGDGSMAEFGDSVKAVRAAVAMQEELFKKNQSLAETERIQSRIGINSG